MNIENPIALQFIMQDDLFILNKDRDTYLNTGKLTTEISAEVEELPVIEDTDVVQTPIIAPKAGEFNYMGKKGEMLILVHYPHYEHMNEAHITALENILKRKGIAIGDIAILNMAKNADAPFDVLIEYFNPQKLLIMGEQALPAGIAKLGLNQPQPINKLMALYSFSFDEMMSNDDNKRTFWGQMKGF